jgi:hypothetical protein
MCTTPAGRSETGRYPEGRSGSDRAADGTAIATPRRPSAETLATGATSRRTPLALEGALNAAGHHARCAQATAWHGTACARAFHRLVDGAEAEGRTEIAEELRAYHAAGVLR